VLQLWSGRWLEAGEHAVPEAEDALDRLVGAETYGRRAGSAIGTPGGPEAGRYEMHVVSSGNVSYHWDGVIGNTGPLNGPGALKGLNPPLKLAIAGDRAVWCIGYNERQPGCFTFNLSTPQNSAPVSLASFERVFGDLATDGELVYLPNEGNTPESNNYYHLPETFVVAYNLSRRSIVDSSQFCMHNFTAPGATTEVCMLLRPSHRS